MNPYITFKTDRARVRYPYLQPTLANILDEMADWAQYRDLPFMLTETVSTKHEDFVLRRSSDTHSTARGADVRIRGWSDKSIEEFMKYFNDKYQHLAAIGAKSGKHELVIRHDCGAGDHMHIQIGKVFAVDNPLPKELMA